MTIDREEANKAALARLIEAEPVLIDIKRAIEVVPGMRKDVVLTSGAPLEWADLDGVQRRAVINALLFEKLAADEDEAIAKLASGEVGIEPSSEHACVGVGSGIYTASMPVYVVENKTHQNRAYCHILEGNPPRLFVNGAWGDDVVKRLEFIDEVFMPVVSEAIQLAGGIPIKPIMRRAIGMGDDLHTRNDAATLLLISALTPTLLDVAAAKRAEVDQVISFLQNTPFSYMRVGVAAAKSALDSVHGMEGCSVVTSMIHSVKDFAIRVAGLGDRWFRGPHFEFQGKYFWGSGPEDVAWGGGESTVMESIGLGGFAQVAAFALPFRGSVEAMIERNLAMYEITVGENPELKIPYFDRGIPALIDVVKVADKRIAPCVNAAVIRKDGEGVAGVGPLVADLTAFDAAAAAYREKYG